MNHEINVVILAAGKGTRLGVDTPKPLLTFQRTNLIGQVLNQVSKLYGQFNIKISIIIGHKKEQVKDYVNSSGCLKDVEYIYQDQQLGTGHAIAEYLKQTKNKSDLVLILCADTPLITTKSLVELIKYKLDHKHLASGLSFVTIVPFGYGRIKRLDGYPGISIVEEKDANEIEKKITEVNSGIYLVDRHYLSEKITKLDNNNKSGEFYLTDIMDKNRPCGFLSIPNGMNIFLGVNTMKQLEEVEKISRLERINDLMKNGVHFIDANNVYIDLDVEIESGSTIMPNVHLRGKTKIKSNVLIETGSIITNSEIEKGAQILPYTIVEDSTICEGSAVGPFARIRPGSVIGQNCKVGNFVETKKSNLKAGSKVSHLSYVGDAEIGENTNIGCGFITCNYDGKNKHKTIIGSNCFIGSDSQMIAPVKIGNDCFVASGSTINSDLKDGDFAISRTRQITKEGMAKKFLKNK